MVSSFHLFFTAVQKMHFFGAIYIDNVSQLTYTDGIFQGRFQSFGQGGARWRAKRAEIFWPPPVNFWHPPAGGCQFLQGGANFYRGVPTINP